MSNSGSNYGWVGKIMPSTSGLTMPRTLFIGRLGMEYGPENALYNVPPKRTSEPVGPRNMGHHFGAQLLCDHCGTKWQAHQDKPGECPNIPDGDGYTGTFNPGLEPMGHCKQGHPRTFETGFWAPNNHTPRFYWRCRACSKERTRRLRQRRKA